MSAAKPSHPPLAQKESRVVSSLLISCLHEWIKRVLLIQLVSPNDAACDLYCGKGRDFHLWSKTGIRKYLGIELSSTALQVAEEECKKQERKLESSFLKLDPCVKTVSPEYHSQFNVVRCSSHVQHCFSDESGARTFMRNVSRLLKPGGLFFGTCPDSSAIWLKYQKAVESLSVKHGSDSGSSSKPVVVQTALYSLTFSQLLPFDPERRSHFGLKYHLKFKNEEAGSRSHVLVHFPTLIRLAEENGLQLLNILSWDDVFEDCWQQAPFAREFNETCRVAVDSQGKPTQSAREILGLHSVFVFEKAA